ncbi:small subunit ribosomal protein S9 [Fistulifera solaris]|uniref:Small subunit ribosomal protein S9 n=1 Tax=Fistulifera solaris TaxID=1519565 RepID=A0A1Z5K435_FISSO|nr:small subunit ribosomal protein S9 [Fistulifera solaris]|eukprot:GAX20969.1 small subunit ribosomal protein S9 [Fistulifera solaris]
MSFKSLHNTLIRHTLNSIKRPGSHVHASSVLTSHRSLSSEETSALFRFRRSNQLSHILNDDRGKRPNSVMLFPGDYQDDAESMWDDDEDDYEASETMGGYESDTGGEQTLSETDHLIEELRRREAEDQAQRAKWIENSLPPVWKSEIDERGRAYGRGGRKKAAARVWIQPGFGEVTVNKKSFVDYFPRMSDRDLILQPLVATETCGDFDVQVMVQGGGLTGQAGAVRHGLAHALNSYNPDLYRPPLKRLGLLERDARRVERKKVGHKKARKSPQWVRR